METNKKVYWSADRLLKLVAWGRDYRVYARDAHIGKVSYDGPDRKWVWVPSTGFAYAAGSVPVQRARLGAMASAIDAHLTKFKLWPPVSYRLRECF